MSNYFKTVAKYLPYTFALAAGVFIVLQWGASIYVSFIALLLNVSVMALIGALTAALIDHISAGRRAGRWWGKAECASNKRKHWIATVLITLLGMGAYGLYWNVYNVYESEVQIHNFQNALDKARSVQQFCANLPAIKIANADNGHSCMAAIDKASTQCQKGIGDVNKVIKEFPGVIATMKANERKQVWSFIYRYRNSIYRAVNAVIGKPAAN